MELMIDNQENFLAEWGSEVRRAPYEEACRLVEKRLQAVNEEMSARRGWLCIKNITWRVLTADLPCDRIVR